MLIKLEKVSNARKEGKWGKLDIEYSRDGGKSTSRTLVAIGPTKDIMNKFREDGAVGKMWEIKLEKVEKDGKEFWNWIEATPAAEGASPAKAAYQAKSTYETPEERARRNLSICRQNALTNAVQYMIAKDGKATPEQILALARTFTAFTTGLDDLPEPEVAKPAPKAEPVEDEDFADDIPF